MLDPVEGFTNIEKYCTNFFAFVKGTAKGIVNVNKLVYCRITCCEARLQSSYNMTLDEEIKNMFINNFFHGFPIVL